MREVRAGTFLLNAKGKPVKVTNVYFSRESAAMVQISANYHTTITHPLIDTKTDRRKHRNRPHSPKIVTTASEWHSRRHTDIYRFLPPDAPHPMSEHLHPSSPHNLRRSGDMWGFSTVQNQAVRSFDDSSCLICPIGRIGWAQVDIAKAILSCWGRTRHLPDLDPTWMNSRSRLQLFTPFSATRKQSKTGHKTNNATEPPSRHPLPTWNRQTTHRIHRLTRAARMGPRPMDGTRLEDH